MDHPTITLEEHFSSANLESSVDPSVARFYDTLMPPYRSRLADVSPNGSRIAAMNSGGITIQVLSNSFGITSCSPEIVAAANEQLAKATSAQPRFRGFATLPMKYPTAAAAELERCVQQFGFVGALIDAHLDDGRYYDGEEFSEVFAAAERLDVPIYFHPTTPTDQATATFYKGNYNMAFEMALGIAAWGWHSDTALSVLRLYAGGVFERFPNLKIVIGRMGELIPFQLDRVEEKLEQICGDRTLTFKQTWERNIWVTTSGMFTLSPMACVLRNTKIDRIMFSVDWPFSENEQGQAFLKKLQESGMVSKEEFEMIAYKNAEALLRIKAKPES